MGISVNTAFARLFRKYRLRSEFETLHEFGDALTSVNIIYDNSIFSRWQKGQKIPTSRTLLIQILKVFIDRTGVRTLQEANAFMEAAGHGYLTDTEIKSLPPAIIPHGPFQAPKDISAFVGRDSYLHTLAHLLSEKKTVLLSGPSGVGKTTIAIKIAHMLRDQFPDGILWYKIEDSSLMNILASIAYMFGKDLSNIKDLESRVSIVRSILHNKKLLMIFDNVDKSSAINLLFPNTASAILVTSVFKQIDSVDFDVSISLGLFTLGESYKLFESILGTTYVKRNKEKLHTLITSVENLPLAVSILAKMLKAKKMQLSIANTSEKLDLAKYFYDNKNLKSVLDLSFSRLNSIEKRILISSGIFQGPDFSAQAVAAVAQIPISKTLNVLSDLNYYSLVEQSSDDRYRINSFIAQYVQTYQTSTHFKRAIQYFTQYFDRLSETKEENLLPHKNDIDNIVLLLKYLFMLKQYPDVITLWKVLSWILWELGEWTLAKQLGDITYVSADYLNDVNKMISVLSDQINYMNYWQIDVEKTISYCQKAIDLSKNSSEDAAIAYIKLRLERLLFYKEKKVITPHTKSLLDTIIRSGNNIMISSAYLIFSDLYIYSKDLENAQKYCEQSMTYALQIKPARDSINLLNLIYSQLALILLMRHSDQNAYHILTEGASLNVSRVGSDFWNNLAYAIIYEHSGKSVEMLEHTILMKNALIYLGVGKYLSSASALYFGLKTYLSDTETVASI